MNLRFIKWIGIYGLVVFFSSSFAANSLVDDFNDGDNKNSFDGIWFYYDDTKGSGKVERLQVGNDQTSVIDVTSYTYAQKPGGGFDYNKRIYTFEVHEDEGNKYGFLPFTLGDKWQTSDGKAEAFVGISTFLKPDSSGKDLTGTNSVKFKLRSHLNNLKVAFIIETADIAVDSTYAYYRKVVNVSKGKWNEFSVSISELTQPDWTPETGKKPFNSTQVIGLTWEVSLSNNPAIEPYTVDTLDVDDIFFSDAPNAVSNSNREVKISAIKAFYSNGIIQVKGDFPNKISNGMITLLDAKGKMMMTKRFTAASEVMINLSDETISNGLYLIQISNINNSKEKILSVKQPIFITR
ncbi:MAG: hypothetical protein N2053_10400 [Chitinispirillaceae bacterium]|nr:hypothetical protein [Chitinispirillaceae bacterium]